MSRYSNPPRIRKAAYKPLYARMTASQYHPARNTESTQEPSPPRSHQGSKAAKATTTRESCERPEETKTPNASPLDQGSNHRAPSTPRTAQNAPEHIHPYKTPSELQERHKTPRSTPKTGTRTKPEPKPRPEPSKPFIAARSTPGNIDGFYMPRRTPKTAFIQHTHINTPATA